MSGTGVHGVEKIMTASGQAKAVQVGVGVLICKGNKVLVGRRCSSLSGTQLCYVLVHSSYG